MEVMGRNAGWIALHAGIGAGADVILLPEIRDRLWPFLEERGPAHAPSTKSREEVLESLLRSHDSIEIDLAEIRKRARGE